MRFWMDTRLGKFLQPQIEIQGQVEGEDDPEMVTYTLRVCLVAFCIPFLLKTLIQAMVCQITAESKHSHLVAIIKGAVLKC